MTLLQIKQGLIKEELSKDKAMKEAGAREIELKNILQKMSYPLNMLTMSGKTWGEKLELEGELQEIVAFLGQRRNSAQEEIGLNQEVTVKMIREALTNRTLTEERALLLAENQTNRIDKAVDSVVGKWLDEMFNYDSGIEQKADPEKGVWVDISKYLNRERSLKSKYIWRYSDNLELLGDYSIIITHTSYTLDEVIKLHDLIAEIDKNLKDKHEAIKKITARKRKARSTDELEQAITRGELSTRELYDEIQNTLRDIDAALMEVSDKNKTGFSTVQSAWETELRRRGKMPALDEWHEEMDQDVFESFLRDLDETEYTYQEVIDLKDAEIFIWEALQIQQKNITAKAIEPSRKAERDVNIEQVILGLEKGHLRDYGDGSFLVITSLPKYLGEVLRANLPANVEMFREKLRNRKNHDNLYTFLTLQREIGKANGAT